MRGVVSGISSVFVVSVLIGCAKGEDAGPRDEGTGGSTPGAGGAKPNTDTGGSKNASDVAASGGASGRDEDGSTGAGGTTGSEDGGTDAGKGGAGGTGPGASGWTAMPLIVDDTDPQNLVRRAGNDRITGIHYASPNDGWVTTSGGEQTFTKGGGVFKTAAKSVTSLLFSGNRDGLCKLGTIDFLGIDRTGDGYAALAYACDIVASHDGGKTFGIEKAQAGSAPHGLEKVLALRSFPGGTMLVGGTGYFDVTEGTPGPTTSDWKTVWAPEAVPPTPNPVPQDQCRTRFVTVSPLHRTAVHLSPDATRIAYVTHNEDDEAEICLSKDGGRSFFPRALPDLPAAANEFAPSGIVFASDSVGITFWANYIYPDATYIYRTTDGGDTWSKVTLPAALVSREVELNSAFFAPDGLNGWIVGYDHDASVGLILRTMDGGATWGIPGGDLAAKAKYKLRTGFALDAHHIWVGGDRGVLLASEAGGD